MHSARLTRHALDEHANSHSRRESVRVDDNVGLDSALTERHVHRRPFLGADTFLSVPRGELVADHGATGNTECDVQFPAFTVAVVVS